MKATAEKIAVMQVPWEAKDYESFFGKKFRNIFIKGIQAEVKGLLVGIVDNEISIGTVKYGVPEFSNYLEWYNETTKEWLPCTKTVNN